MRVSVIVAGFEKRDPPLSFPSPSLLSLKKRGVDPLPPPMDVPLLVIE